VKVTRDKRAMVVGPTRMIIVLSKLFRTSSGLVCFNDYCAILRTHRNVILEQI
jgi:hypothetical protein